MARWIEVLVSAALVSACGGAPSSTEGDSSSGMTTTTTTAGDESATSGPSCGGGDVYVEPGCDDGDAGTVLPPSGCLPTCTDPGHHCDDTTICLPASTRTCACPEREGCCPECRGVEFVCLDRALFDCSRYGDSDDCGAAPTLIDNNDSGFKWYCTWETVVAVSDPLTCAFAEATGECVENALLGGGCNPAWSCFADDDEKMVLYRGPPYEIMRYDECIYSTPEGWTACDPLADSPPVCDCQCEPDFPG